MKPIAISLFVAGGFLAGAPRLVLAGMPSVGLSDAVKMSLESYSFFLMGLLLSAACIRWLWNWIRRDFPRLPRLSYPKACAIVVLWGLLFVLVLTMISGARELMTPGAWKRNGATYKLNDDPQETSRSTGPISRISAPESLSDRMAALSNLSGRLREYASRHEGRYPATIADSGLPPECWRRPGPTGSTYKYVRGATLETRSALVAYESSVGGWSLALFADGRIAPMEIDAVARIAPPEEVE